MKKSAWTKFANSFSFVDNMKSKGIHFTDDEKQAIYEMESLLDSAKHPYGYENTLDLMISKCQEGHPNYPICVLCDELSEIKSDMESELRYRDKKELMKTQMVYTPDQLLKAATRFSKLVAQAPSTSTTDLSEMMADLAKKFDPEALASVQKLANAGQLSAGTTIDLSVDVTYAPVKKGSTYVAQATVTVSGKPDNVKAAVQAIATRYSAPIAAKLTAALAKQWAQEEEEKKREPAAPGPRGGSFNFRQLNFTL